MAVFNQMNQTALNQAVDSILGQTLRDFEFLIYDDGSIPEAADYIRKQEEKDSRIRVCGSRENHGLGFSLNVCADMALGRYIARMDADDIAVPERLAEQYDFLEREERYDWCGSNAFLYDGQRVWGRRVMPEVPGVNDFLRFSPYIHPTVMYRRELLDQFHYSDAGDVLRCEDYEIFMRLHQSGFQGYNIQQELLWFRENQDSYRRRNLQTRLNEMKLRFRGFRDMGVLFPLGWLYALRPLMAAAVPNRLIMAVKRNTYGFDFPERETSPVLQKTAGEESSDLYSVV